MQATSVHPNTNQPNLNVKQYALQRLRDEVRNQQKMDKLTRKIQN